MAPPAAAPHAAGAPAGAAPAAEPHNPPSPTTTPAVAPGPDRQFSLSDAWLAERAALSVLDDFPFDLPVHLREEGTGGAAQRGYAHPLGPSHMGTGFGAGPFGAFGIPFAPAGAAGVPLPTLPPPSAPPPRLERLNASAPVFDPVRQTEARLAAAAVAQAAAPASAGGLGTVDVDRVVAGLSKEEMMRMMSEMQKRLERE